MASKNHKSYHEIFSSLGFMFVFLVWFIFNLTGSSLAEAQQVKITNLDMKYTGENSVGVTLNMTKPGSAQSQGLSSQFSITIVPKNTKKISTLIFCGDGFCDKGTENNSNCPQDSAIYCDNGICEVGESSVSCPGDCVGGCGDVTCAATETCSSCPSDCEVCCGNGTCDYALGEDCNSCSSDCSCGLVQGGAGH